MTLIDITVIIAYFLLMAGMGFWFMRRSFDEYTFVESQFG